MRTRRLPSSRADKGDAARMVRIAGACDAWSRRRSSRYGRRHSDEQGINSGVSTNFDPTLISRNSIFQMGT